jgi:hypothetical protein
MFHAFLDGLAFGVGADVGMVVGLILLIKWARA